MIASSVILHASGTPNEVTQRLRIAMQTRPQGLWKPHLTAHFALNGFKCTLVRPLYDAGRPVIQGELIALAQGTAIQGTIRPTVFSLAFGAAFLLAATLYGIGTMRNDNLSPWGVLLPLLGVIIEAEMYRCNRRLAISMLQEAVTGGT